MTEQEKLIWFAGIVDGEGSICAFYNSTGGYVRPSPSVGFNITNTNVDLLCACQDVIESITDWRPKAYISRWHANQKSRRELFKLSVRCHGRIKSILAAILPYLIAKRKQAEIAITLCESFGRHGSKSKIDWERRTKLAESIKALNHGFSPETNMFGTEKVNGRLSEDRVRSMARVIEELK